MEKSSVFTLRVEVSPSSVIMKPKEKIQLSVSISPIEAKQKGVIWMSDNDSIASVDYITGVVTAKAKGIVTIRALSNEWIGKTGCCNITVT